MKRAAFGILAVIGIGLVVLAIFQPRALAVIYGSIFGYGHPRSPPDIAEGANFSWLYGMPKDQRWTSILRRKFPVGTRTATLLAALQQQGFENDQGNQTARYQWGGMPCLMTLTVEWTATKDTLTSVSGGYGSACL